MTEMSNYLINQLQPEKIGRLFEGETAFGEPASIGDAAPATSDGLPLLGKFRPRNRFLLIGLAWIVVILVVGFLDRALVAPKGIPTVIQVLINPEKLVIPKHGPAKV